MTMNSRIKSDHLGRFVVAITNPTLAPRNCSEIKSLVQPEVAYQIIPGIPKYYEDSTWRTILELLPYTE